MIAEISVNVSFLKHTLIKSDAGVVEGDYNTTKLIFNFEEDVSGKRIVFKMSNPAGELIFLKDLEDNEVLLVGRDADGYTCSLFSTQGLYPFELVLYGSDSKLTSAPGWLNVSKRQVSVLDSVTSNYLPLFEKLLKDLEDKLARESALIEPYITENLLNPENSENGGFDLEGNKLPVINSIRTIEPISVEGHHGVLYVRTALPNNETYRNCHLSIYQFDSDGNFLQKNPLQVLHTYIAAHRDITLDSSTTSILVYINDTDKGVTFADWCVSVEEIEDFIPYSLDMLKENLFVPTPTRYYQPANRGFVDSKIVTNLTGNEIDKAPSVKLVKDRLSEKVTAQKFVSGKSRMYCARANNPNSYYELDSKPWLDCIPVYTNVESNIVPNTSQYGQATIIVVDPKYRYQSSNKGYVDDAVDPIKRKVTNVQAAVEGKLYTTQEEYLYSNTMDIPSGALPYFYCEQPIIVSFYTYDFSYGESVVAKTIQFLDQKMEVIKTVPISSYMEIPEGAKTLAVNIEELREENPDLPFDHCYPSGSRIIFQVKVGA